MTKAQLIRLIRLIGQECGNECGLAKAIEIMDTLIKTKAIHVYDDKYYIQ